MFSALHFQICSLEPRRCRQVGDTLSLRFLVTLMMSKCHNLLSCFNGKEEAQDQSRGKKEDAENDDEKDAIIDISRIQIFAIPPLRHIDFADTNYCKKYVMQKRRIV